MWLRALVPSSEQTRSSSVQIAYLFSVSGWTEFNWDTSSCLGKYSDLRGPLRDSNIPDR